jgi:hypothetical protein
MWEHRRLTALWPSMACYSDGFTYFTDNITDSEYHMKCVAKLHGVNIAFRMFALPNTQRVTAKLTRMGFCNLLSELHFIWRWISLRLSVHEIKTELTKYFRKRIEVRNYVLVVKHRWFEINF